MRLTGEKLDYAISEYVNGTLSELDRRALEEQLLTDAEARLHVTQEAHLTNLLRDLSVVDPPQVDFEAFGAHLSSLIDKEPAHVARPIPMRGVWVRRLAIAAAVGLAAVVGMRFIPTGTAPMNQPTGTAYVVGPAIEAPAAPAEIRIAVGPSDVLAKRGQTLSVGDETLFAPPPRVVITAGYPGNQVAMDLQPLY